MSETAKTRSRKSATKPAVEGSDQQAVAENTPVPAAQAEPEQAVNPEPQETSKGTVLGAFLVSAKSEQGFWRAGIKFERSKKTLLVVCELDIASGATVDASDVEFDEMLFVDKASAERIYREPNLSVKAIDL
ncbi:hypothetical protein [Vibrio cholerae]|uniref:hypothetical protein n=1 Tax=Vibrio cholerae TaxID=666 RepID=UPI0004E2EBEA|nr:hypothetical protein [Vibrio cholerae]EGR1087877.1 hypothetical protein [Vibrio cholerae]KFE25031.1 hypothetical protein DA89_239 [Vibrio cholerae]TXZ35061.1 hypothetical protein FXE66_05745 [Vibrio cholerae]BCK29980.1 hypothetical protein VCSRO77_3399 [Vibrio cholerae]